MQKVFCLQRAFNGPLCDLRFKIFTGNNLESKGSTRKNKKRHLQLYFQIKIKFRKKIRGTAASNYRTLISSGLFPVYINSNLDVTVPAGAKQGQFTLQSIEKLEIPQIPKMIFSKQISGSLDDSKLFLPRYHHH